MEKTMAAVERLPEPAFERPREDPASQTLNPMAHLALLHHEARETARLANLLGRTLPVSSALVFFTIATVVLGDAWTLSATFWTMFMLVAAAALGVSYRRAMAQPFERAPLKSFSQDLNAILMFAGVAWGSGAFLALPADAGTTGILIFSALAGGAIAVLLREHESALHFRAPTAALSSFACVLRPVAGGALGAGLVLIACGAVGAAVLWANRRRDTADIGPELAGLPLL
jgi:hypothetical protein